MEAFKHRSFYTQTRLHRSVYTRMRYTQKPPHTEALRRVAFTQRSLYTELQKGVLHTETFRHRRIYTQEVLHKEAFTAH